MKRLNVLTSKDVICSRCDRWIRVARVYDAREHRVKLVRLNEDGSEHRCKVRIEVDSRFLNERGVYAKPLEELDRCGLCHRSWWSRGHRFVLHRVRHGYRAAMEVLGILEEQLSYDRFKLKLLEKLLAKQWPKLWAVGTHNYHSMAVDRFLVWFKDYYGTLYHKLYKTFSVLCEVLQRFMLRGCDDWWVGHVLERFAVFIDSLNEIREIALLVQDISWSGMYKSGKEYWLRQVKYAYEWHLSAYAQYRHPMFHDRVNMRDSGLTIRLDYEEAIRDLKETLERAFRNRLAELKAEESHRKLDALEGLQLVMT